MELRVLWKNRGTQRGQELHKTNSQLTRAQELGGLVSTYRRTEVHGLDLGPLHRFNDGHFGPHVGALVRRAGLVSDMDSIVCFLITGPWHCYLARPEDKRIRAVLMQLVLGWIVGDHAPLF